MSPRATSPSGGHGLLHLGAVTIDGYSAELKDGDGFIGDRASSGAFRAILDEWRDRLREVDDDPLGDQPSDDLTKKKLDKVLAEGEPEAAGLVHGAIEDFANQLADVTGRFLRLKAWRQVERIVVGGGLRASRTGEVAIGRASVLLKSAGREVELKPVRYHPDDAALIGSIHLAPAWVFTGHDAILALDVGGSKIRAGIVEVRRTKGAQLPECTVEEPEVWRYADSDAKPGRNDAVERIGEMLKRLVRRAAKRKLALAPFVGVGCPGVIAEDGSIERGGQNLPGNWESSRFNLPAEIRAQLPEIGDHQAIVVMHNDAVVQGLSELPFIQDVARWGAFTIGTGLGNAVFTNRRAGE